MSEQKRKKSLNEKVQKVKIKAIPCEVYSRVTGYYRPVQYWNRGKQQEFKERKFVNVSSFRKIRAKNEKT